MTTKRELELEAEIVRLREALEIASGFIRRTNDEYGVDSDESEIEQCVQSALSAQFTPTALPELIEKVEKRTIERCAEKLLSIGALGDGDFLAAIRALPTGCLYRNRQQWRKEISNGH